MTEQATATTAPPQPESPAFEILCPLCDYNLRGLVDPRCPECGYSFDWDELLDPSRQKHPYLFEHHPRRPIRSFVRTILGGLRPRRFWGRLNPAMPSRPRLLAVYAVLVSVLLVSAPLVTVARQYVDTANRMLDRREQYRRQIKRFWNDPEVQQAIARSGSVEALVDQVVPSPFSRAFARRWYGALNYRWDLNVPMLLVMLAWPWLTLASLMTFRWSMRRARVRTLHVVRCVVYGFDWGFWLVPLLLLLVSRRLAADLVGLMPDQSFPIFACGVFAVYGTYRLGSAYARYLRFDHPYVTAFASQLIVGTFVTCTLLALR